MMTCREVCNHTHDYVDGRVSTLTRLRIRLHVLFCRNCTSFVDQTRQTKALVRHSLKHKSEGKVDPKLMAEFKKRNQ